MADQPPVKRAHVNSTSSPPKGEEVLQKVMQDKSLGKFVPALFENGFLQRGDPTPVVTLRAEDCLS